MAALGAALRDQGKLADATASYQRALEIQPDSPEPAFRLACTLVQQGKREQAIEYFQRTLQGRPDHAEAHIRLGILLAERGRLEEGISHLRQAVTLDPKMPKRHHNLGVALMQHGKLEEARRSLEQALRLQPNYAQAAGSLGNVFAALNRREDAIASYRHVVRCRPRFPAGYTNLGLALLEAGRPAEAVVALQQAHRLRPNSPQAHNNLALALTDLGRFAEAEAHYQEALRLNPHDVTSHNNLGSMLRIQGRLPEALASYQLAVGLDPQSIPARWNRSLALLQAEDFTQGWPEYEWRWKRRKTPPRVFQQPLWNGSPLGGRTILLHMEQGLGDKLQFIRYASLVIERQATVIVECPARLIPLLSGCRGIDRLVAEGSELPHFDVQAPLMSLPRLFRTTVATIPAEVPYLFVDAERTARWQRELATFDGFKVGICWQGNRHHLLDYHRSVPLATFAPLAEVPGVRLIGLQKGYASEQVQKLGGRFRVIELASELDPKVETFVDTAAIMKNLDLVVTVDTAIAHLAGGLGVPVWVALSRVVDWRWLSEREDCPWYPSMRLFRQTHLGELGRRSSSAWQPSFAGWSQHASAARQPPQKLPARSSTGPPSWKCVRRPVTRAGQWSGRTAALTFCTWGTFAVCKPPVVWATYWWWDSTAMLPCVSARAPTDRCCRQPNVAEMLAGLACVDFVVVFDEATPEAALTRLKPDLHCKGADYAPPAGKPIPEAAVVQAYGGRVEFLPLVPEHSTSELVRRLRECEPAKEMGVVGGNGNAF